ncbi:MAG: FAD-dependent oxidoreductase, partial [Ruaniaceae bacterium]|nr:FAD-dependent oxidoreductase [Ruaniaceae bacterium]
AEGTIFRPSTNLGTDLTGQDLLERYDAVVLAMGATIGRELPIPGREFGGIHQAMEYLPQANRVARGIAVEDQITAEGKDVIIIGGGDTGADCLGTALRQGARSVTQLEIMPRPSDERPESQPWPTYPMIYRVASAHEEGGERVYAVSTAEFLGSEGRVSHLVIDEVDMSQGRPVPVEGTRREISAQLVLLAMGFTGTPKDGVVGQLGLDIDERGRIRRTDDFATAVPGVFVAGDAGRGQSLIVWAIAEGRSAAASADRYLRGQTELPAPIAARTMQLLV